MVRELRAGAGGRRSRRRDARRGAARRRRALLRRRRPQGHGGGAHAARPRTRDAAGRSQRRLRRAVRGLARTPLAVVAVVEGTVMGGGFGLACVADVALAGDERGLPPARDLARPGAGADRALPGRAPRLCRSQAPRGHRRPARRAPRRCARAGARGACRRARSTPRWPGCWATSCTARPARCRHQAADRAGAPRAAGLTGRTTPPRRSRARRKAPRASKARRPSCRSASRHWAPR